LGHAVICSVVSRGRCDRGRPSRRPRPDILRARDVAFVADNPGDWMIHCHILDHQQGGMMAVIRIS